MKEKLLLVVQNKAVRAALVALIMAILAALGINLSGCTVAQREEARTAAQALVERIGDRVQECAVEAVEAELPFREFPADAGVE